MLGLGWSEMLVIAVVVLIVVGPKDLPVMLRNLGRIMGSMRRMSNDFRREIDKAIAADEFREARKSISDPLRQTSADITRDFNSIRNGKVEPTGKLKPSESGEESVVDAIHAQAGIAPKSKEVTPAAAALRAKVSETVAESTDAATASSEQATPLGEAATKGEKVKAAPRKRATSKPAAGSKPSPTPQETTVDKAPANSTPRSTSAKTASARTTSGKAKKPKTPAKSKTTPAQTVAGKPRVKPGSSAASQSSKTDAAGDEG